MKKEIRILFNDEDSSVEYVRNAITGLMTNKTPVVVYKDEYRDDTVTISLRLPDASSLDDNDAVLLSDMFSSLFNDWLNPHRLNISVAFEGHPLTQNLLDQMEFFINEINYRESLSDCRTISNKARDFFGINWGDSYESRKCL